MGEQHCRLAAQGSHGAEHWEGLVSTATGDIHYPSIEFFGQQEAALQSLKEQHTQKLGLDSGSGVSDTRDMLLQAEIDSWEHGPSANDDTTNLPECYSDDGYVFLPEQEEPAGTISNAAAASQEHPFLLRPSVADRQASPERWPFLTACKLAYADSKSLQIQILPTKNPFVNAERNLGFYEILCVWTWSQQHSKLMFFPYCDSTKRMVTIHIQVLLLSTELKFTAEAQIWQPAAHKFTLKYR